MYKISLFLISILFFAKSKAQELTIPYEVLNGIPIVKVSVNDKDYRFAFDTGAFKTVVNSNVFLNLPITSKVDNVGGISSAVKSMNQVKFSFNLSSKRIEDKEVIYSDLSIFTNAGCDNLVLSGIIGRDIMEDYIIEINPQKGKILFYNPLSFNEDKIQDFTKIKLRKSIDPRVPVRIGKQDRYVLFDTGSHGKLSISDYKLERYIETTQHTTYKSKGSSYGIHGVNNDEDINHTIYNAEIQIGKLNIEDQTVETSRNDFNNMGFSFISQFISYLDLKGKNLYLKQISKNYFGETSLKNLGFYIRYDTGTRKNTIVTLSTKNDKLKLGDNLISINRETPPENNCDMYSFLKKFFGIPIKIKLERENKIIEIEQTVQDKNF